MNGRVWKLDSNAWLAVKNHASVEIGKKANKPWPMIITSSAIFLFVASILLPQGVGIRLTPDLPNLDLPRMAMLALNGLFIVQALTYRSLVIAHAPRTLTLLAVLAIWQFFCAVASSSPKWSSVWAVGNVVTYWGFAFSVIVLMGRYEQRRMLAAVLTVLAVSLALWSSFEFITQSKLVAERNIYAAAERAIFSVSLRRRVVIDGAEINMPYMSLGPYALNLALASALCALGGFVLMRRYRSIALHCFLVTAFVFAVLSAQSRAGAIALGLMLLLAMIWTKTHTERFCILLSSIVASVAFVWTFGSSKFYLAFAHKLFGMALEGEIPSAAGSIEGRWYGLKLLWSQKSDFWLLGYGPGSIFDSERATSPIIQYSDSGSFFGFIVELGLPGGLMIMLLVLGAIITGIRSRDTRVRAATIGLTGFSVTALSSITPWTWGIALVMAGVIESWSKTGLSVHRAPLPEAVPTADSPSAISDAVVGPVCV